MNAMKLLCKTVMPDMHIKVKGTTQMFPFNALVTHYLCLNHQVKLFLLEI